MIPWSCIKNINNIHIYTYIWLYVWLRFYIYIYIPWSSFSVLISLSSRQWGCLPVSGLIFHLYPSILLSYPHFLSTTYGPFPLFQSLYFSMLYTQIWRFGVGTIDKCQNVMFVFLGLSDLIQANHFEVYSVTYKFYFSS